MASKYGTVRVCIPIISNTFGAQISVRQCQRLFHALGYSHIRPQPYPSKEYEDSEARETLKKRTEIENDDSLILIYQNEVHFQIQTAVISAWSKKGSAPTVKLFPSRFKTPYSGFIILETGESFVARPEKFNYEITISSIRNFLEAHPAPEGKKYALVMDNVRHGTRNHALN